MIRPRLGEFRAQPRRVCVKPNWTAFYSCHTGSMRQSCSRGLQQATKSCDEQARHSASPETLGSGRAAAALATERGARLSAGERRRERDAAAATALLEPRDRAVPAGALAAAFERRTSKRRERA